MQGDSAAAAIFQAWFLRLAPAIAGDELGPLALDSYDGRFSYITRFVVNTLAGDNSPWCDNVQTPRHETCPEAVTAALHEGIATLTRTLGGDLARWRWDAVHRAVFPHQGLDAVGLLRPLLSRSMPSAGDWSTVNAAPVDSEPVRAARGPGLPADHRSLARERQPLPRCGRAVGPLPLEALRRFPPGLARRPAPPHANGAADIEKGALGHLCLTPAAPSDRPPAV